MTATVDARQLARTMAQPPASRVRMTPATVNTQILDPLFRGLLPERFDSPAARVLMLAIQQQEDPQGQRVQRLSGGFRGPAHGLWQFERAGGVAGVLNHGASMKYAALLCEARGVPPLARAVWMELEHDDLLAAGFARLLLLTDPAKLPAVGDASGAWECYLRTWRPGAAKRDHDNLRAKFFRNYTQAMAAVGAQ